MPHRPSTGSRPATSTFDTGALVSKKDKTKRDPIADIVKRAKKEELVARVDAKTKEDRKTFSCHSFGAQFAEVGVDEATGEIRVRHVASAFAAGKILNAKTARSQFLGGIVWGIGLALTEKTERDGTTGRVVNRDLASYHVPVNADVPLIDVIMIDEVDPHVNEIGAKGIGEIGITGIGAALANAVYHATGKRVRDLPITLGSAALKEAWSRANCSKERGGLPVTRSTVVGHAILGATADRDVETDGGRLRRDRARRRRSPRS